MPNKRVSNVRRDTYENAPVGPTGTEIEITTEDEWSYLFRRLTDQEPFELVKTRREDGSVSNSEIIPQPVAAHFEETPGIELVNAKVAKSQRV